MRYKWHLIVLLVAVVLIATAGLLRYNVTRTALIKVSIFNLSAQLSDLQKWEKWDKLIFDGKKEPDYIRSANEVLLPGNTRFSLQVNSPAAFVLHKQENDVRTTQFISLRPVNADRVTQIEWTKSETGLEWVRAKLMGDDEIESELNSLKMFAENTSHLYEYPIKVASVSDPLLCLYRQLFVKENAAEHIPQMLIELSKYLSDNNIIYQKDHYYVAYHPVNSKNTEIAVGIPVNKQIPAKGNFEILKFPANGRLLVGDYEGEFAGINKLYAAMDKYVTDKNISKVALPMEKYPYNAALNTGVIKMQVIYPIY